MKIICKPILIEDKDCIYKGEDINRKLLDELRKTHRRIYIIGTNKGDNIEIRLYKNNKL